MLTWTPYSIVSFISAFTSYEISPLGSTLPAAFAKSSAVWSSLFYIFSNKIIRKHIISMFLKGTMFKAVLDREIGKFLKIYLFIESIYIFFECFLDEKTTFNRTRAEDIL